MNKLWIDIETRSRIDLITAGTYRYAEDESTEVLIFCYALNDGPVQTWLPRKHLMPKPLRRWLTDPAVQLRAHNAAFERLVLTRQTIEELPLERWYCTAAQMRAAALPGKLEDAARALDARYKKDHRGAALIKQLSIPQADGTFNEDPALMAEFAIYCANDVLTMRAVSQAVPELTQAALEVYWANEYINDTGVPIDADLCDYAIKYGDAERAEAMERVINISGGTLTKAKGTKLTEWVFDRLPEEARAIMVTHKDGKEGRTLDVSARNALMEREDLDEDVMLMIESADLASSSSVSKFATMLARASLDGRLRGEFVFNGASQTGRFSSMGAQLHNFPRTVAKDPAALKLHMKSGTPLPGVLRTLKSMLRPAVAGKGTVIVRGDWNAIEARGLPWLAGSPGAEDYLDAFRDANRDIYVEQSSASGLGGERQPGKVVVLALGYGGASGALLRMAKGYSVTISDPDGVVRRWRNANQWAVQWWHELWTAAVRAVRRRDGVWYVAGRVAISADANWMMMRLPSGRMLYYPQPRIEGDKLSYLKAAWKPKKDATEWPRATLWHGTLAENATQAVCADLLREALIRGLDDALPISLHVHDEIGMESAPSPTRANNLAKVLKRTMLTLPHWAVGLPLAVEIDIAPTFRK